MSIPKTLFIGNAVNNIETQSHSWSAVIEYLKSLTNNKTIHEPGTPFPILYEKIFIEKLRTDNGPNKLENKLKKKIADLLNDIRTSPIHAQIVNLKDVEHILTTNYDYALEKSLVENTNEISNQGIENERYYSLFRQHTIDGKVFWHIHGEINDYNTITLGYDHYFKYSQKLINYYIRKYTVNHVNGELIFPSLETNPDRIKMMNKRAYSWADLFFTSDIYILGYSFELVEYHLWWLLTFRMRCRYEMKIQFSNKIFYFIPSGFTSKNKAKVKLNLFRSFEVNVVQINFPEDNIDYYSKAISMIDNGM